MTPRAGARIAAAYLGTASVLCQTVVVRELLSFVSGNELAAGLVLGSWLLWTSLGSLAGRFLLRAAGSPARAVAALEACSGLLAPLMVAAIRTMPAWLGTRPGELPPGSVFLVSLLLAPAPLCLALGALFPSAAALRSSETGGAPAGRSIYLRESLAAAGGGLLFSLLLAGRLPGLAITLAVAAGGILLGALTAGGRWLAAAVPAAVVLLGGAAGADRIARRLEESRWPGLIVERAAETPVSLVTVTRLGNQRNIHRNGRFSFSLPDRPSVEELVDLPMSVRSGARRVLLVGGAWSGAAAEVLRHPVDRLDVVEADAGLERLLAPLLDPGERRTLADPRARIAIDDPRRFLRRSATAYDLIIFTDADAESILGNRLLTREAFAEARRALAPGGLLAFGIPSPPNYVGDAVLARNASLYATLASVFPAVSATPLDRTVFFAAETPAAVDLDPSRLAENLSKMPGLGTLRPETVADRVPPERVAGTMRELSSAPWAPLNTDARPVVHLLGIAWWSDRIFGPGSLPVAWLPKLPRPAWGLLAIAGILLAAVGFGGGPGSTLRRSVTAMAATGFGVIVAEVAIMLRFQVVNGHLLRDIGLLTALVMLGLAAGSARACGGPRSRSGMAADVGLVAVCLVLALQARGGTPAAVELFLLYAEAFAAGLFGGMRFAASVGSCGRDGAVYSADLAGACLGALFAPLLLIPALGLPGTLLGAALVKALTALPAGYSSRGGASISR